MGKIKRLKKRLAATEFRLSRVAYEVYRDLGGPHQTGELHEAFDNVAGDIRGILSEITKVLARVDLLEKRLATLEHTVAKERPTLKDFALTIGSGQTTKHVPCDVILGPPGPRTVTLPRQPLDGGMIQCGADKS